VAEITLSYLEVRATAIKEPWSVEGFEKYQERESEKTIPTSEERSLYIIVFLLIPIPIISILEIY